MKVCMISTMYPRFKNDTRGLMVSEVSRNLVKSGVEVNVVAPSDSKTKPYEVVDGVKVNRFNYFFPKNLQRLAYGAGIPTNLRKSLLAKIQIPFFALAFLLKTLAVSRKCDLIHTQWISCGFIAFLVKKLIGKPFAITVRRVVKEGWLGAVTKFVLSRADHVFCNSSYTLRECLKITTPISYSINYNAIDFDKFKPTSSKLRKELGIKENIRVLFSLGLLVEKKGFDYLIKAMKIITKTHKNVILLIGGPGTERDNLNDLIKTLGLTKYVKLIGEVKAHQTPLYFSIADVFVLPSILDSKGETETFGVVLVEALGCETPVVASKIGGIPDIVTKDCGYLVEQKNPKALADAILKLFRSDKKRRELGKKGRNSVSLRFSWKQSSRGILDVYKKLIS